jgi:hypothetical protein
MFFILDLMSIFLFRNFLSFISSCFISPSFFTVLSGEVITSVILNNIFLLVFSDSLVLFDLYIIDFSSFSDSSIGFAYLLMKSRVVIGSKLNVSTKEVNGKPSASSDVVIFCPIMLGNSSSESSSLSFAILGIWPNPVTLCHLSMFFVPIKYI